MTIIKLSDGTIINASSVELVNGALKITTAEKSVEELAAIFSDKSKTSYITLLTESGAESGFKTGFTSFAGILYDADGEKTVALFQPVDLTEQRVANAEGAAHVASNTATEAVNAAAAAEQTANTANEVALYATDAAEVLAATLDSILTDVIPNLMA